MRCWRWQNWLLLLLSVLLLASYFGLLSWAPLERAIERLGNAPGVRDTFPDSSARQEALFVIFAFLLLTPLAAAVLVFVVAASLALVLWVLGPIARMLRIKDGAVALIVVAAAGVVSYARADAWLPWVRWAAGLVARAFIAVRS